MYKTEKEARACMCPVPLVDRSSNRCAASICMAWRWHYIVDPSYVSSGSFPRPPAPRDFKTDKGYCGLIK